MDFDAIIQSKGFKVLVKELGLVGAERFINNMLQDQIDYTEWRKNNLLEESDLEALSSKAMEFVNHNE